MLPTGNAKLARHTLAWFASLVVWLRFLPIVRGSARPGRVSWSAGKIHTIPRALWVTLRDGPFCSGMPMFAEVLQRAS